MKQTRMRYTVLMERDESGGFTVTVPSLPGCISQGDTWDEARKNIEEAIAGYIETLKILKKPVPVEVEVTIQDPVIA
ncbi:type II toxin-antitoxin system HicB family antitoxin [Methanoregula sp.]|uniref:type II toxin-antitoxin system HicB family antitoxin n=1 Tax=Methanoregula sp. TaxID=2052170 RepID=UPI0026392E64|nr:type II toxin-antitoxin system HicB family antitoxin [Methanoregula sp.]MDD5142306.1 type II toxin-antitoxin system HicB family antitoxin [Methanoregula sp.]